MAHWQGPGRSMRESRSRDEDSSLLYVAPSLRHRDDMAQARDLQQGESMPFRPISAHLRLDEDLHSQAYFEAARGITIRPYFV